MAAPTDFFRVGLIALAAIISVELRIWFPSLFPERRRPPIRGVGAMVGLLAGGVAVSSWASKVDEVGPWLLACAVVGWFIEAFIRRRKIG